MISRSIIIMLTLISAHCFVAVSSSSLYLSSKVTLYRCDEKNQKLTASIDGPKESLAEHGLRIRLCFELTPQARLNDIYILKVNDFVFTKTRTPGDIEAAGTTRHIPSIIRQKAVDHGVAVSNDLTMVLCNPGSEICVFETTLTGYLFLSEGTIHGKGSVLMQSGRTQRRRYQRLRSRQLQHIDTFEDVFIDIDFVGEKREKLSLKQGSTIGVIVIIMIIFCCCCTICCCLGIFLDKLKERKDNDDSDNDDDIDDVQTIPAMITWASKHSRRSNPSKKGDIGTDDDDVSETHSLDEDEFWVEDDDGDEESTKADNNNQDEAEDEDECKI